MAKKAAKKKATTKRAAARGSSGRKKSVEMLLVGSKTKAALKAHGVNVASDALDGLNNIIYWYLDQATARAAANGRKTVRSHDFVIM
jgi:histone H3/H4